MEALDSYNQSVGCKTDDYWIGGAGMDTFTVFDNGQFILPETKADFAGIAWSEHPAFAGVELKHIVTAKDTDGRFSYHLVRIAPGCGIGNHIHETRLETHEVIKGSGKCINAGSVIPYEAGTISLMQAGVPHEVIAGAMANILIVEDEKKMQEIITEYMRRGGHTCFTADDGMDAVLSLKNNPMDLMILDIMMPHLDGFSVCKMHGK